MSSVNVTVTEDVANGTVDFQTALVAGGTLNVRSAADVLLAAFPLGSPAWAPAAAGNADLSAPLACTSAAASGTMSYYEVADSSNVVQWSGTIGTGGAVNLVFADLSVTSGLPYAIAVLTHVYNGPIEA